MSGVERDEEGAGETPAPPSMIAGKKRPEPREIMERSEPRLTAGSCVLGRPELAAIVQNAILHFEGDRYFLRAWCVMPNHVHVVVKPRGHTLSQILHAWKSFTAVKINGVLERQGLLWERESFNHLIRSWEDVARFSSYTEENAAAAGLCLSGAAWPFSSSGIGFQPVAVEFVDPRTTPFVEPRDRGDLPHLQKAGGTYFVTWRLLDAVVLRRDEAGG